MTFENIRKLFLSSKVSIGILISSNHEFEKAFRLYLQIKKNNKYSPFIVIFPISNYHNQEISKNTSLINKLKKNKLKYLNFFNNKDVTNLERCGIYITFSPYIDTYPKDLWELLQRKRLIYIPYGPLINYVNYNNSFYDHCWIIFLDSAHVCENFRIHKGDDWVSRCENIGFLEFKTGGINLANCSPGASFKFRVLITEHWTLSWDDPDPGSVKKTGYCKFEKYSDTYLSLPSIFPEIQFIFRPHPYMFENLINSNVISRNFRDDFVARFTSFPNAEYDDASNDFYSAIFDVDALISSGISAWCQFVATNKPALMLLDKSGDGDGLNQYGKDMTLGHYRATVGQDIIDFINEVVIGGHDSNMQIRNEIFAISISGKSCISESIVASIESRL